MAILHAVFIFIVYIKHLKILIICIVLDQIQPKCIVIGSKQDDRLIKTIQIPGKLLTCYRIVS